jgi:uncharacterized RmlC-like cupin family protein
MTDTYQVQVVSPGQTHTGKQGFTYQSGISTETVGAKHVCMAVLPMPNGARAKAHYHDGIETIAYLLEGECVVHYGDRLERQLTVKAGEQAYVPGGVPHVPSNESGRPCTWVVVHSSGSDQDGIVMLPELDQLLTAKLGALKR